MSIQVAAQEYLDAGWDLVRIQKGEKRPTGQWLKKHPQPSDFSIDDQLALKCGEYSNNRICLDGDCPEAIKLLPVFFSPSVAHIEGRPGKPESHWWLQVPGATTRRFKDIDGTTILDLLSTGAYAVAPPSLHSSGEVRSWLEPRPTLVDFDAEFVHRYASLMCVTALLARHWPDAGRHDIAGPLAGLLLRCGVAPDTIPMMIEWAAKLGGDTEVDDRVKYARNTIDKYQAGLPVTGGRKLAELLGVKVKSRICTFLGASDFGMLDQLNERWFMIDVGAETVVGEEKQRTSKDGSRMWSTFSFRSFEDFRKKLIKEPDVAIGTKKDGTPILQSAADYWLEHDEGRRYEQLVYSPEASGIEVGPEDLNGWKGFTTTPEAGGDWSQNKEFIREVICGDNAIVYEWVLDWMADLFQRPGEHGESGLILRGGQGIGKNYFLEQIISWCFNGRHARTVTDGNRVFTRFNDMLSGLVFLFLDEAGLTDEQSSKLKALTTGHELDIERKNISVDSERSMLHVAMATNRRLPAMLDGDDRRFLVLDVVPTYKNDTAYFKTLAAEMSNGGRAAMLHELVNRPYHRDGLRQAPRTSAKSEVQRDSNERLIAIENFLVNASGAYKPKMARVEVYELLRGRHSETEAGWTSVALGMLLAEVFPRLKKVSTPKVKYYTKTGEARRVDGYDLGDLTDRRLDYERYAKTRPEWPNATGAFPLISQIEAEVDSAEAAQAAEMGWLLLSLGRGILRRIGINVDAIEDAAIKARWSAPTVEVVDTPF